FVPGWTGGDCSAWCKLYDGAAKGNQVIKSVIDETFDNYSLVNYIKFSKKESKKCNDFFDFAKLLKKKIYKKIKREKEFDIVGHSMGGLDILAAITQGKDYLTNVYNCITVASPLKGVDLGEIYSFIAKIYPDLNESWYVKQCKAMDPDQPQIKKINKKESRLKLLKRVYKFYQFRGTLDKCVMKSSELKKKGVKKYTKKIETIWVGGADHSGSIGITQDPRTIRYILEILVGEYKTPPAGNKGNFVKGIYVPKR
ncbi:MAG: alpha/beta hydrolase, partial [Candidatus Omnitrophica bacterium]|nr:alpha/beta hydrolase [Candidatus Omnitrophota bacterium]